MPERRRVDFRLLQERVEKKCMNWSQSLGADDAPVPLEQFANALKIRRVRFDRIISTAGLAKNDDELEIIVNTDAFGATQAAEEVVETLGAGWSNLPAPIRFSIAHEIVHAVYCEGNWGEGSIEFLRKHSKALESSCSRMARILLVPRQALFSRMRNNPFDVKLLRQLLNDFKLSPEVLVRRLELKDVQSLFEGRDGVILLIRESVVGFTIIARHTHGPQSTSRLTNHGGAGQTYSTLDEMNCHPELTDWLKHADSLEKGIDVPCANDSILPCSLKTCLIYRNPRTYLVSLEVKGQIGRAIRV